MELIQHFSHKKHPLMFVEEFKNDGEIEVIVCSGCDKSICGPAYKCSHCNFFLHKSCAELPPEIQHPVHPNHSLLLQTPSEGYICDACCRDCERCFFYQCKSCKFDIDIECASIWRTNTDDGHQHEFVPIFHPIHFTCEVCGEDRNSAAQVCRICQLLTHAVCTRIPCSIKIVADRHVLTLIYSLGKVMKEQDDVFCNLCYKTIKKVNLKYAGYYCQQCNFVAHLNCAYQTSIGLPSDTIDSRLEEEEGILFKEAEEGEELQHFHHEHKLIISRNEVEVHDHKLCEGCMQSIISAPFYSCEQYCNYFLHSTCARRPLKKRHPTHRHPLTLSAREDYNGSLQFCDACDRLSHGFAYICDECDFSLDIRCCSIPIKTFKHEGHQHSIFLATSSVEKCNACDRPDNYDSVFVCTECNFALGFECATLPLKAKHEYDTHPLLLTSTAESDSEECYCLICEDERNPNHWFYYCIECNFVAHPHCVVGRFPYIKYGRNFILKDHQHPLSLVWRTKDSRPCDACSQTFYGGVVINCTQCKSIIHCSNKCFDKLFKNKITS